jgi:hypothetical protein
MGAHTGNPDGPGKLEKCIVENLRDMETKL